MILYLQRLSGSTTHNISLPNFYLQAFLHCFFFSVFLCDLGTYSNLYNHPTLIKEPSKVNLLWLTTWPGKTWDKSDCFLNGYLFLKEGGSRKEGWEGVSLWYYFFTEEGFGYFFFLLERKLSKFKISLIVRQRYREEFTFLLSVIYLCVNYVSQPHIRVFFFKIGLYFPSTVWNNLF